MLRRIASRTLREPVARAASPGPQPVATSAAVLAHQYQLLQQQQPPQVLHNQTRGLVSSVLLSSTRDAYESKKVAQLKAELKSRGLASSGKKDELIKRLVNNDTVVNGSTLTAPPQLRKKSTLASLRKEEDGKKAAGASSAPPAGASQGSVKTNKGTPASAAQSAKKAAKEAAPIVDEETAKEIASAEKPLGSMKLEETPASLEPGTVHNAAADGLAGDATAKASPGEVDEAGPPKKTTPPGQPPHKAPKAKETFNVQIPYYPDPPVEGPEIPLVTSYTSQQPKESSKQESTEASSGPKAISVSASSDISHASDISAHESDKSGNKKAADKKDEPKGIISELVSDLKAQSGNKELADAATETANKGADHAKSALASAAEEAKSALASAAKEITSEVQAAAKSSSGSPSGSGSSSGSKPKSESSKNKDKDSSRPLNDQERTGLYGLLGIVAGGFVIGGLGKSKKSKKADEETKQKDADAKGQATVVKSVTVKPVSPVAAVAQGDGGAAKPKPSESSVPAPTGSKVKAPIMCVPKGTQLSSGSGTPSTMGALASPAYNASSLARLAQLSTCEVSDAMLKLKVANAGFVPGIELYSPHHLDGDTRICGPAYTVRMVAQSDTEAPKPKAHFVDAAVEFPDHVMVVSAPSNIRSAVWGGLMTARAQHIGLKGVILDGNCRDLAEHRDAKFPVFARGHSTVGQSPFTRPSELQVPITIQDPTAREADGATNPSFPKLTVNPGDLVLADLDGVVFIPPAQVDDVIRIALKGRAEDANCLKDITAGMPVKEAFAKNRSK